VVATEGGPVIEIIPLVDGVNPTTSDAPTS
jgi:hypothetical protein